MAFVRAEQKPTAKSMSAALMVVLGLLAFPIGIPLGFALIVVLFSLVVTVASLLFALWVIVFAFGVAGLSLIVAAIVAFIEGGALPGIFTLGTALTLIGLSILGGMGSYYLAKAMMRGIVKFCRWSYEGISKKIGGENV